MIPCDPAFPDRPQHPDFWRLSECILQSDGAAEDRDIEAIIAEWVDVESLGYMAMQRALWFLRKSGQPESLENVAQLSAMFFDGFLAGAKYQERGGHRDE